MKLPEEKGPEMRIGITTAPLHTLDHAAAVRAAAMAAEEIGYSSVWVCDATLGPFAGGTGHGSGRPGDHFGAQNDGGGRVNGTDSLPVLATACSATRGVRIGTGLLGGPWAPRELAHAITTLDALSGGRLALAVACGNRREAAEVEALIDALDRLSSLPTPAPPGLRRPPIFLMTCTVPGLDLVARRADGWVATGMSVGALPAARERVRELARGHGRDPDRLEMIVRADVVLTESTLEGDDRPSYHGDAAQVARDLLATEDVGASEVVLRLAGDAGLDDALDSYARIAEAVYLRIGAPAA
jgi:alkanesulfonate monooxygenase SsuD/methylene tetrahydromethanopterin reductase-like flavin-dependent oxidoreductase (luciferase family)